MLNPAHRRKVFASCTFRCHARRAEAPIRIRQRCYDVFIVSTNCRLSGQARDLRRFARSMQRPRRERTHPPVPSTCLRPRSYQEVIALASWVMQSRSVSFAVRRHSHPHL